MSTKSGVCACSDYSSPFNLIRHLSHIYQVHSGKGTTQPHLRRDLQPPSEAAARARVGQDRLPGLPTFVAVATFAPPSGVWGITSHCLLLELFNWRFALFHFQTAPVGQIFRRCEHYHLRNCEIKFPLSLPLKSFRFPARTAAWKQQARKANTLFCRYQKTTSGDPRRTTR
jgi:hypothetical protein